MNVFYFCYWILKKYFSSLSEPKVYFMKELITQNLQCIFSLNIFFKIEIESWLNVFYFFFSKYFPKVFFFFLNLFFICRLKDSKQNLRVKTSSNLFTSHHPNIFDLNERDLTTPAMEELAFICWQTRDNHLLHSTPNPLHNCCSKPVNVILLTDSFL